MRLFHYIIGWHNIFLKIKTSAKAPQYCSFLVVQALIHQLSIAISEVLPCVRDCTGCVMDTVSFLLTVLKHRN